MKRSSWIFKMFDFIMFGKLNTLSYQEEGTNSCEFIKVLFGALGLWVGIALMIFGAYMITINPWINLFFGDKIPSTSALFASATVDTIIIFFGIGIWDYKYNESKIDIAVTDKFKNSKIKNPFSGLTVIFDIFWAWAHKICIKIKFED